MEHANARALTQPQDRRKGGSSDGQIVVTSHQNVGLVTKKLGLTR